MDGIKYSQHNHTHNITTIKDTNQKAEIVDITKVQTEIYLKVTSANGKKLILADYLFITQDIGIDTRQVLSIPFFLQMTPQ